jgi:anti-sigma regulatory factor (Ser/Thr protein kinase)
MMTVWGFRILPLCMPLSIICMHFVCYGQASNKQALVHILSILDGVICVAGFTALLIPHLGMNSVYIANVLNGVVTTVVIILYACVKNRRFPKNMEELMAIPADFGVPEADRLDLTIRNMDEVVTIAQRVQDFCQEKGIDRRRSGLAGLALEEMAGNVVDHGFRKDSKKHTVDVRVVYKDDGVLLRIKDDCIPFDPAERQKITDPDDPAKNIGIRMVYRMADDINYQNILGLNVLTIRI